MNVKEFNEKFLGDGVTVWHFKPVLSSCPVANLVVLEVEDLDWKYFGYGESEDAAIVDAAREACSDQDFYDFAPEDAIEALESIVPVEEEPEEEPTEG